MVNLVLLSFLLLLEYTIEAIYSSMILKKNFFCNQKKKKKKKMRKCLPDDESIDFEFGQLTR